MKPLIHSVSETRANLSKLKGSVRTAEPTLASNSDSWREVPGL